MNPDITTESQPLFPLNTVLFPGGILPLQIFEQRYLDLVKSCMKNEHGFVIVLINNGKEVSDVPKVYKTGTYTNIVDWETLDNGLLGITAQGVRRVHLHTVTAKDNGLLMSQINDVENCDKNTVILSKEHDDLIKTLQELSKHPYVAARYPNIDYSSANEVCNRLSELLPIPNLLKQELLETFLIDHHIEKLQIILRKLAS